MSTASNRAAIITGGASGMGLGVAHALAKSGGWDITIIDLNASVGETAAQAIRESASTSAPPSKATFAQADITDYDALAAVFQSTFTRTRRLDFVFANAGIAERPGFYAKHDTPDDGLAPPPKAKMDEIMLVSRICLDAVYYTTYLAQHYFRQTPREVLGGAHRAQNIVMTSSSGGIYPTGFYPLYTAAKYGVVGFMRAIAPSFYKNDGIRVNTINPGPLRTGLLPSDDWDRFPQDRMTDVDKVAAVVLMLIEGKDETATPEMRLDGEGMDGGGRDLLWGNAVEISGQRHYYRATPRYSDETMEKVMLGCDPTLVER